MRASLQVAELCSQEHSGWAEGCMPLDWRLFDAATERAQRIHGLYRKNAITKS